MQNVPVRAMIVAAAVLASFGQVQIGRAEPDVQRGKGSYYHAERFDGRPMANGDRFDAQSNAAASKTLPLGTVADVTNRDTGETRRVVIEDRGPYVQGRVIDLSPKTAEELGMRHDGVAPVEVKPVGKLPNKARDGKAGTE